MISYKEDPTTKVRLVTADRLPADGGSLSGECECGTKVEVPRNGSAVTCSGCQAQYKLLAGWLR